MKKKLGLLVLVAVLGLGAHSVCAKEKTVGNESYLPPIPLAHPISHLSAQASIDYILNLAKENRVEILPQNKATYTKEKEIANKAFVDAFLAGEVKPIEPYAVAYNHMDEALLPYKTCPPIGLYQHANPLYYNDTHEGTMYGDMYYVGPYVIYKLADNDKGAIYHIEIYNRLPKAEAQNYETTHTMQEYWRVSMSTQYRTEKTTDGQEKCMAIGHSGLNIAMCDKNNMNPPLCPPTRIYGVVEYQGKFFQYVTSTRKAKPESFVSLAFTNIPLDMKELSSFGYGFQIMLTNNKEK